ncbi:MAG: hypothetical protein NT069_29545, partial [Planctomycetota bacterium]|nr:hypothetical protein [Planctomycetota bacterium]
NASACAMLGEYRVIAMLNEGKGAFFPLMVIDLEDPGQLGKVKPLTLPGTHGTGTSCLTTKVGKACLEMIRFYMGKWGTCFTRPVLSSIEFCDLFAEVHLEVVNLNKSNKVMVGGKAFDFSEKRSTAIKNQWLQNKDWLKARKNNRFHENRFRDAYQADSIFDVFANSVQTSRKVMDSIYRYMTWKGLD